MDTEARALIAVLRRSHERLASLAAFLAPGLVVQFAGRMGRSASEPFRARLRASLPGTDVLVAAGDGVMVSPWPTAGPAVRVGLPVVMACEA